MCRQIFLPVFSDLSLLRLMPYPYTLQVPGCDDAVREIWPKKRGLQGLQHPNLEKITVGRCAENSSAHPHLEAQPDCSSAEYVSTSGTYLGCLGKQVPWFGPRGAVASSRGLQWVSWQFAEAHRSGRVDGAAFNRRLPHWQDQQALFYGRTTVPAALAARSPGRTDAHLDFGAPSSYDEEKVPMTDTAVRNRNEADRIAWEGESRKTPLWFLRKINARGGPNRVGSCWPLQPLFGARWGYPTGEQNPPGINPDLGGGRRCV